MMKSLSVCHCQSLSHPSLIFADRARSLQFKRSPSYPLHLFNGWVDKVSMAQTLTGWLSMQNGGSFGINIFWPTVSVQNRGSFGINISWLPVSMQNCGCFGINLSWLSVSMQNGGFFGISIS
jgi:hypothetical protein